MVNEFYSFKLLSHPEKPLVEHVSNVALLSKATISDKILYFSGEIDRDILGDVAYIIGLNHDLGKATTFFQEYLNEIDESKKLSLKNKPITHHSLLSALFTYYIVKKYLKKKRNSNIDYLPLLSFLIVKRHHSDLDNALDEIRDLEESEKYKVIKEQIEHIDYDELQEIINLTLQKDVGLIVNIKAISKAVLQDYKQDILRKDKRAIRNLKRDGHLFLYFITQLLYSALLNADKSDVIFNKKGHIERMVIGHDIIDRYRTIKGFIQSKENINEIRNSIYSDVISKADSISLDDKIFSLNVPTGVGKTLTSFSFALKLRERLKNERGFIPRIIYSLPFLSIIDQNYAVFEDVFTEVDRKLPDSQLLLKHHHLSEVSYNVEGDEYEIDESQFLIEGWTSEIIVTTFWQFFHTLFSNKNRIIRRFHTMINSIIILDEVQSIPHKYWRLVKDALTFLAEKFNSYIIFVTATQPLIFDEKHGEIKELVTNKERYFNRFDRIELIPYLESPLSLEDFKDRLKNDLINAPDKDFLVVLNTISASVEVYQFIKHLNLRRTYLYYLSTNIIPKERLKRIREVRQKRNGMRKVIVSTQLIEAGVDIDVDTIYRDFAPLDCINQVAGRCNRNYFRGKRGRVSLFVLKDHRREFYKYIYDPFLIRKTMDVFRALKEKFVSEIDFLNLSNKYFGKVVQGMSEDISEDVLSCLYGLEFKELSDNFKLIDGEYSKADVFVEVDKEAMEVWKQFKKIRGIKNPFERKKEFLKIKKDFYNYVISVPKTKVAEAEFEGTGIIYVNSSQLETTYDTETGYIRSDQALSVAIF